MHIKIDGFRCWKLAFLNFSVFFLKIAIFFPGATLILQRQYCTGKNPVQCCLSKIWPLFGDFRFGLIKFLITTGSCKYRGNIVQIWLALHKKTRIKRQDYTEKNICFFSPNNLKELRNCILRIILAWSLFCLAQVYVGLHFFTNSFGKLVFCLPVLSVNFAESNVLDQDIKICVTSI